MKKIGYIKFRVSLKDKMEIKRLAYTLGYDSVSDYLLSIALSGITHRERIMIFNELHSLRMRNAMVENNINQIAKHLNLNKTFNVEIMKQYIDLFENFANDRKRQTIVIKKLIDKLHEK